MIGAQITRAAAAVFLTGLLVCAPSLAQGQAQQVTATIPSSQTVNAQALKAFAADPKRAQKAIDAGEKAEAEGRPEDALVAYDEAARYAPQDMAVVARSAVLRSRLVRTHVDNAERLGLAGNIPEAIAELRIALHIDPTNGTV